MFDQSIVTSFVDQQWKGQAYTEKQGGLALKIIARYKNQLSNIDIDACLANPRFKYPFRTKSVAYEVSITSDQPGKKTLIRCQFPYDKDVVDKIRSNPTARWDSDLKCWYCDLNEPNVLFVDNLFSDKSYKSDERFQDILKQCRLVVDQMDQHVPILDINDDRPVYINPPQYLPELKSQDLTSALFEARLHGISVFSDKVYAHLSSDQVSETARQLLKNPVAESISVDKMETPFDEVCDVMLKLMPCLVVMPTSGELENLSMLHRGLSIKDVPNECISVMFRLPSDRNDFNQYIKDNKLNSRISENTKIVVVQSKIPRPLLSSDIRFNMVLNLSKVNAHYTLRNYLKSSYNIISYVPHPDTKIRKYANM